MAAANVTASLVPHATRAAQVATPAAGPVVSPMAPAATPASSGPQLWVLPGTVRLDESFQIDFTGLRPGQKVTVSSSFMDEAFATWAAQASWVAAGNILSLGAQLPADGDFAVPDPMGLIWAAIGGRRYTPPLTADESVEIVAVVEGREIGRVTVKRTLSLAKGQPEYVDDGKIVANYFAPAPGSPTPAPAVICLGGSDGGLSSYADSTAALLAAHGYAAMNLAYFGAGNLPGTLDRIPLEYFRGGIDWLRKRSGVSGDRIGVIGYSRGGELALLLGAHYPELMVVVSFSGSGYVMPAPWEVDQPAWTWHGQPIPFWSSAITSLAEASAVEIPVERTNGPILMISGDGDRLWYSSFYTDAAWERVQRLHHPWPDQFIHYPGAGHFFGQPYVPIITTVTPDLGGDVVSNQVASVNSWQAVLHLLEERLRY